MKKFKDYNINLVLVSDENYMIPTSVAIASILENRDPSYTYNIYVVFPENTSKKIIDKLFDFKIDYPNASIIPLKVSMNDLKQLHNSKSSAYLAATETALLKFKLPKVLNNLDKVLYLDGDIIVRDNLVALYNTELGDNYVAAVRDLPQVLYDKQIIGKEIAGIDYFNSGVMLLNLKKMRKNNITDLLIETKRNLTDSTLMDQNVFNIVFNGSVIQLSALYNSCFINLFESRNNYSIKKLNDLYNFKYEDIIEMKNDVKIVHFASKLKPWLFYDVPFADEWLYYYKKSIYKNSPLQRIHHTKRDVVINDVKDKIKKLSAEMQCGGNIIPIVFATNRKYVPYIAAVIQSIYENSNPNYIYQINILMDAELTRNIIDRLNKINLKNIRVYLWDCRHCFDGENLYSVGHYSKQMYYRWLIPEILSLYKKVLYLDCDLIVLKDIATLYNTDLGNNIIAAINNFTRDNLNNYLKNRLKISVEEYYNSGVLLINNDEFLMNKIKYKSLDILRNFDKLACPDQDAINIACKGRILKLNDNWNFQWHHLFSDAINGEFLGDFAKRYRHIKENGPYIIHYTSQIKPWNSPDRNYADYFWEYCRKTIFYEEILYLQILDNVVNKVAISSNDNKTVIVKKDTSKVLSTNEYALKAKRLENEIAALKNSRSYKIGRMITFFPRLLRKILLKNRI